MSNTAANDPESYVLYVEDPDGRGYDVQITGTQIAWDEDGELSVFRTDKENVVVHDGRKHIYWVPDDPASELQSILEPGQWVAAMKSLGINVEPVPLDF